MTASPHRLEQQICLVTGATSGIGLACALQMAREGAAGLVLAGRRAPEGDAAAQACRALGADACFVPADVTQQDDVLRIIDVAVSRFGRLDVAFNNAGYQEPRAPLHLQDAQLYQAVFDANVRSVFYCLRHQLPLMLRQGAGRIVVNASVSGLRNPNPGLALYSASKAALISLMRSAALEYGPQGIRINAVAPGRVSTDMMRGSGIDLSVAAAGLPLRRMGTPEEVAEAVVWLASDAASFVCGHVLATDGGFLAA